MKSNLLITLLIAITYTQSFACYNEYNINLRGQGRINMDESLSWSMFYRSFDLEFAEYYVASVDLNKKELYRFEDLSDISIQLCRLGRVEEALELLKWLHEQYPNEYKIVSNLGTTYELAGKPKKAREYLLKAIRMNPNSHHGSEWFHLRILNAKKLWNNDANWLLENEVLNLDTTTEVVYGDDNFKNYSDTAIHIRIQLTERLPFTPENDLMMAKILLEYGDYLATHFSVRNAGVIYRMAKVYDKNNVFKLSAKIAQMDKIVAKNKRKYDDDETTMSIFKQCFPPKEKFRKINRKHIDEIKQDTTKEQVKVEEITPKNQESMNWKYGLFGGIAVLCIGLFFFFKDKR